MLSSNIYIDVADTKAEQASEAVDTVLLVHQVMLAQPVSVQLLPHKSTQCLHYILEHQYEDMMQ